MAINIPSHRTEADTDVMIDINTTPLIDVMLVLLIMLIITIPIQTHAVQLDMPVTNPPPPSTPPVVVDIDIDFDGTISWNGEVIPDSRSLGDHLRQIAAQPTQPEVHLRPNKLVLYKNVVAVMAAARRLGVTKIGLVDNETANE
ncbi:MAG TPA: biopolymer transporter ExbD [Stellaceae bacterium]|nr:biopolymer transporter ExbD [Stellaceae bacterium]